MEEGAGVYGGMAFDAPGIQTVGRRAICGRVNEAAWMVGFPYKLRHQLPSPTSPPGSFEFSAPLAPTIRAASPCMSLLDAAFGGLNCR